MYGLPTPPLTNCFEVCHLHLHCQLVFHFHTSLCKIGLEPSALSCPKRHRVLSPICGLSAPWPSVEPGSVVTRVSWNQPSWIYIHFVFGSVIDLEMTSSHKFGGMTPESVLWWRSNHRSTLLSVIIQK
jgi:hypothetical protein